MNVYDKIIGFRPTDTPHGFIPVLRRWLSRFGSVREWVSTAFVFILMAIAIRSIEQAQWLSNPLPLTLDLALAVFVSLLLIKMRLPDKIFLPSIIILGMIISIWQVSHLVVSSLTTRHAWQLMWQALADYRPGEEVIHFTLFLLFLTWIAGFVSTWFMLRKQNIWIAVGLGVTVLLVNLNYLPKEYHYILIVYLVAAMLMIGITRLMKQHTLFKKVGSRYPKKAVLDFMLVLTILVALSISGAWFIPETNVDRLASGMGARLTENLEQSRLNLFKAVPGKWPIVRSSDREKLTFAETPDQSKTVLFVIAGKQPLYARTVSYNTYYPWGWASQGSVAQIISPQKLVTEDAGLLSRDGITYTVENKLKTDFLLTAGELIRADIPVSVKTAGNDVPSVDGLTGETTPPSEKMDIILVTAPLLLKPYQHYTVETAISYATPSELSWAGQDYEPWLIDRYLQLPDNLPARVKELSQNVTIAAAMPYDKAVAIKDFLRNYQYNLEAKTPPDGTDGVDWFLFQEKRGFCNNFASAMVVMLRSSGVPARLAAGYLVNEFDTSTDAYLVRAKNYHAWPEAYFPGYGWIGFEPTPSDTVDGAIAGNRGVSGGDGSIYDEPFLPDEGTGAVSPTLATTSQNSVKLPWLILGILIVLGTIIAVGNARFQRFREARSVTDVYTKMCLMASLFRSGPRLPETPLEFSKRLALALPAQSDCIGDITQAYVETRFSPRKNPGTLEMGRLNLNWHNLFSPMLKRVLHWPGKQ